jgi:predicted GIY-YIG superfamily endonuclease|tara:strand:- start:47 stop:538 length:492 start_codon:yes stop_codon:yes gene_type:complete
MELNVECREYESILQFLDQHEISECNTGWKRRNYLGSFVYVMCLDVLLDGSQIIPLYVGCTSNPDTRILDHSHKAWFQYVDFIMIEEFHDRSEAEKTESDLITKTRPVFNKQVSKRKKKKKYLPKLAMVKNVGSLIYEKDFNGDDLYDWVTEELPYIQPEGLQ